MFGVFMSKKRKIGEGREGSRTARRPARREPSLHRHKRLCVICRHPNREAIEADFLQWRSAADIAQDFDLYDPRAVYRHAHATGLWRQRRQGLRDVLERIIEQVAVAPVTGDTVLKAIKAYSQLNEEGRFKPHRRRCIVTRKVSGKPGSNRQTQQVETVTIG